MDSIFPLPLDNASDSYNSLPGRVKQPVIFKVWPFGVLSGAELLKLHTGHNHRAEECYELKSELFYVS